MSQTISHSHPKVVRVKSYKANLNMSKQTLHFVLCGILLLNSPFQIRGEETEEISDQEFQLKIEKFKSLLSSLSYGDSCDVSSHSLLASLNRQIDRLGVVATVEQRAIFVQYVLDSEKRFCDSDNFLVCDKDTAKCTCGSYPKDGRKAPIIVPDVDKDSNKVVCRYGRGNYCTYYTPTDNDTVTPASCVSGSRCQDSEDGSECSVASMARYLILNGVPSKEQARQDYFAGKICTCQKDVESISTSSPRWRNKRSPSPKSTVSRETAERLGDFLIPSDQFY